MKVESKISTVAVGLAIKGLRERLGMTQTQLMRALDCEPRALSRWEAGDSMPGGEWIIKLLRLCPDQEMRDNFLLDIEKSADRIASPSEQKAKGAFREPDDFKYSKPRRKR